MSKSAPQPPSQRSHPKTTPSRAKAPQSRADGFRRTTARLEGRRDGKPLIFGWGGHLTRSQKSAFQHLAGYGFVGLVVLLVLGVLGFGWLQQTVIIPNQTIATVNTQSITQDAYRKQLAFDSQQLWNKVQAELRKESEVSSSKTPDQNELTILLQQIQVDESNYNASSLGSTAVRELMEDRLIQAGARNFEQQNHVPAATFTPTSAQIDKQLKDFKSAIPAGQNYHDFLAKNGMSDDDVRFSITLLLRRDLMTKYLQSRLTSPTKQIHLRRIETTKQSDAQKVYDEIVHHHGDWNTLAKQYSADVDTKNSGGDMTFVPPGTGDAVIEVWAYAPERKVNDLTVLKDASGTFDVVQVLEIQDSRGFDANLLQSAKDGALDHWLSGQKVASFTTLSGPNQDMLNASRNMPVQPDLNAQLPNLTPQDGAGQPTGGLPGGLPGGSTGGLPGQP
jgi:hypothetical protein